MPTWQSARATEFIGLLRARLPKKTLAHTLSVAEHLAAFAALPPERMAAHSFSTRLLRMARFSSLPILISLFPLTWIWARSKWTARAMISLHKGYGFTTSAMKTSPSIAWGLQQEQATHSKSRRRFLRGLSLPLETQS